MAIVKASGNVRSVVIELPAHTVATLAKFDPQRTTAGLQVISNINKVQFWFGPIPGIGFDPTDLTGAINDLIPPLPHSQYEWTPEQYAHAETLLEEFGFEVEKDNGLTTLGTAPYGPVYAHTDALAKIHFLV